MTRSLVLIALAACLGVSHAGEKSVIDVDKKKKTVTIPCKIAPRMLPNLKQIYPLEVIATLPSPKGQKAHETIVTFEAKPSDVHKALESLGLKPGKPALGENGKAAGPEVTLLLQLPDGKRITVEEAMLDTRSNKPFPKVQWLFTGSAFKNTDPEKDDKVYGADLTGTLITIFPVTNDTVFQSNLDTKEEANWRLETNKKLLPKEGEALKLVIQVP
ncbi:MAG: YdjY domain-containing protein [Gemmataceae bacterium]|nr:YdjY domain-containing protein [Gemmataceae bacterium]MCI0741374.1 YdjY domain-containing protein [Gemmataceae bacterium]